MYEEGHGDLNEHRSAILEALRMSIPNRKLSHARWALYHSHFGSSISEKEVVRAETASKAAEAALEQYEKEHRSGSSKYNEYDGEQFKIIEESFSSLEVRLKALEETLRQRVELLQKREEIYEDLLTRL